MGYVVQRRVTYYKIEIFLLKFKASFHNSGSKNRTSNAFCLNLNRIISYIMIWFGSNTVQVCNYDKYWVKILILLFKITLVFQLFQHMKVVELKSETLATDVWLCVFVWSSDSTFYYVPLTLWRLVCVTFDSWPWLIPPHPPRKWPYTDPPT